MKQLKLWPSPIDSDLGLHPVALYSGSLFFVFVSLSRTNTQIQISDTFIFYNEHWWLQNIKKKQSHLTKINSEHSFQKAPPAGLFLSNTYVPLSDLTIPCLVSLYSIKLDLDTYKFQFPQCSLISFFKIHELFPGTKPRWKSWFCFAILQRQRNCKNS